MTHDKPPEDAYPLSHGADLFSFPWRGAVLGALAASVFAIVPWAAEWVRASILAGIAVVFYARHVAPWRRRRRVLGAGYAERPDAPWTWDREWSADGETRNFARAGWSSLGLGAVLVTVIAFSAHQLGGFGGGAVFLLVPGAGAAWFLAIGWRETRRGDVHLSYGRFPLFVGERVEFTLSISEGGAQFETASVWLGCVEEFERATPRTWCTWSAIHETPADFVPGPGADLRVGFDVPADAHGTRLLGEARRHWQLSVWAKTDAGPLRASFVVPIYDSPAPPGE